MRPLLWIYSVTCHSLSRGGPGRRYRGRGCNTDLVTLKSETCGESTRGAPRHWGRSRKSARAHQFSQHYIVSATLDVTGTPVVLQCQLKLYSISFVNEFLKVYSGCIFQGNISILFAFCALSSLLCGSLFIFSLCLSMSSFSHSFLCLKYYIWHLFSWHFITVRFLQNSRKHFHQCNYCI